MKGSKISNTEWGLVIGVLFLIDVVQFVLDLLIIGALVNRLISFVTEIALAFYSYMRGIKMDTKKILSIVGAFVGEEVPALDAAPFWTIDGLMLMFWDKADKVAAQAATEGKVVGSIGPKKEAEPEEEMRRAA